MSRVSYAMMHPEGAVEMTAAVRKALDGLLATLAMHGRDQARPRSSSWRSSATRSCTTCSSGSTRSRSARRRSRWPPTGGQADGRGARAAGPIPAPGSTSCRASPATSAPTRPGVILAEAPHRTEVVDARRGRRHECRDRPGQPRPPPGRVEPDRPGVRGRPDLVGPARRAGRDRAGPDRPRRPSSRASGSSAPSCGRTSRASPRRPPRRASPGSAARASSRSIAELFLAGVITTDGIVDGVARRRGRRASSPTAGRSRYLLHDGSATAGRGSS